MSIVQFYWFGSVSAASFVFYKGLGSPSSKRNEHLFRSSGPGGMHVGIHASFGITFVDVTEFTAFAVSVTSTPWVPSRHNYTSISGACTVQFPDLRRFHRTRRQAEIQHRQSCRSICLYAIRTPPDYPGTYCYWLRISLFLRCGGDTPG